jgi:hypothetical protein
VAIAQPDLRESSGHIAASLQQNPIARFRLL